MPKKSKRAASASISAVVLRFAARVPGDVTIAKGAGKAVARSADANYRVYAEMEDTLEGLRWRLVVRERSIEGRKARLGEVLATSHWTSHYAGILSLKYDGITFIFLTQYWVGALPVETVLRLDKTSFSARTRIKRMDRFSTPRD